MERFKFRCWDKISNKMVYPDKLNHNINSGLSVSTVFDPDWGFLIPVVSDNVILMQCTGQKDSEGKLIFEGDIVEVGRPDNNYTVIFKGMGFWYKDEEEGDLWVFTAPSYELKVTGNIYEQT